MSASSSIFKNLDSSWSITNTTHDSCQIDYKITMEFANSLYASVTKQFFDFLVSNINDKFQTRCEEVGEQKYASELDRRQNEMDSNATPG